MFIIFEILPTVYARGKQFPLHNNVFNVSLMQEMDLASVPAELQNPSYPQCVPAASPSGPASALGAKPKNGVSQEL